MSSNAYRFNMVREKAIHGLAVLGASETDASVMPNNVPSYALQSEDSLRLTVVVSAESVTSSTGITAKLQHSYNNTTWSNVDSAAITSDGDVILEYYFEANSFVPLYPNIRIVVSTGAGDAVSIGNIRASKRV